MAYGLSHNKPKSTLILCQAEWMSPKEWMEWISETENSADLSWIHSLIPTHSPLPLHFCIFVCWVVILSLSLTSLSLMLCGLMWCSQPLGCCCYYCESNAMSVNFCITFVWRSARSIPDIPIVCYMHKRIPFR